MVQYIHWFKFLSKSKAHFPAGAIRYPYEAFFTPHEMQYIFFRALSFYPICIKFGMLILDKFWRSRSTSSIHRKLSLRMFRDWLPLFHIFSLVIDR